MYIKTIAFRLKNTHTLLAICACIFRAKKKGNWLLLSGKISNFSKFFSNHVFCHFNVETPGVEKIFFYILICFSQIGARAQFNNASCFLHLFLSCLATPAQTPAQNRTAVKFWKSVPHHKGSSLGFMAGADLDFQN